MESRQKGERVGRGIGQNRLQLHLEESGFAYLIAITYYTSHTLVRAGGSGEGITRRMMNEEKIMKRFFQLRLRTNFSCALLLYSCVQLFCATQFFNELVNLIYVVVHAILESGISSNGGMID